MRKTISVSQAAARRFLLQAFRLEQWQPLPDVSHALDALEFVQMDSINVCGRMHDLILWARVREYCPAWLDDLLYTTPRGAFEYPFPNLCALPLRDYPYFVRAMRARAAVPGRWGALTAEELPVAERLLARITAEGPLRTRDAGAEDGHTVSGWGTRRKLASHVLEKLWLQGRLAVHHRENFERWFDLAEHTLPPELLALHVDGAALPGEAGERAHRARKRLRVRRLFRPRAEDVRALGADALTQVTLEGSPRPWYVLAEDLPALVESEGGVPPEPADVHLLAPLDPLVYDRERTRALFGFEYVWEVYTPAAKRRWGYYVLPILWGDRLAGRLDPWVDRRSGTLQIHSLQLEPWVDPAAIAAPLAGRITEFARFSGTERVRIDRINPETLSGLL